jgi:hypothetical protein
VSSPRFAIFSLRADTGDAGDGRIAFNSGSISSTTFRLPNESPLLSTELLGVRPLVVGQLRFAEP